MADEGDDGARPRWGLSDERVIVEKIINHRFNFFMLIFIVAMTSSLTALHPVK